MKSNINRRRSGTLIGPIGAMLLAGCSAGYDATPRADVARAALEKSLVAWKDGGRPGTIEGSDPPIQVVDSSWQGGRKLGSFEVLREEGGEGDRRFAVRLTHRDPSADQEAQYVVLGNGPVWVYREEDYQRMINMDDNPAPTKAKARTKARRR